MKPNTYTRLYAHCVFTPKGRYSLLKEPLRGNIHKYIYGVIKGQNCKPIAINGTDDHIHLLVGFHPQLAIADFVRDVKRSSSLYINSNHLLSGRFNWQEGYGAFTVGYRDLDRVYQYVFNQEAHHTKESFKDEYFQMLTEEGIDFESEHLFEFYDGV